MQKMYTFLTAEKDPGKFMSGHLAVALGMILLLTLPDLSHAGKDDLAAWWTFDSLNKQEKINPLTRKGKPMPEIRRIYSVREVISGDRSSVQGSFFRLLPGIRGKAIQLDGNTSFIQCPAGQGSLVSADFSAEAWIAPAAWPSNWCPLIDHSSSLEKGFFLGIDARGQVGFRLKAGGKWQEIVSASPIPLRRWTHICGTYSSRKGLTLYINGKTAGRLAVSGTFEPAFDGGLLIGKHSIKRRPEGTIRPKGTAPVFTFFDGLLDEIKIYRRALSAAEIEETYREDGTPAPPPLSARVLPAGPPGRHPFGAVYTTLKYYPAWDALWPVGDRADVLVRFDDMDGRFIFWRGTSYVPHWVTENGIWYDNEFCETWSQSGGHEPMSDKRCEFSHVRVLEDNDARVVVHWRYALVDNWYRMAKVDSLSGWGEWADEIYTIYPDGVAVRAVTLYSTQPQSPHEWHEGIIVMGPGQRPEQVLEPGALTLANMNGETHTFTWADGIPAEAGKMGLVDVPAQANIQLINTKSRLKPFVIVSPRSNPLWEIYSNELRPEVSMFPWWNHWPAALKGSDGRYALDDDLASHTSLCNCHWDAWRITDRSVTRLMLNGLTDQTAAQLIPLAASWSSPPPLFISDGTGFSAAGYDPASRSYQISYDGAGTPRDLTFQLAASPQSPLQNPAFVIRNYGPSAVRLMINGAAVEQGRNFRLGMKETADQADLIVWIKFKSDEPVTFRLLPLNRSIH